MTPPVPFPARPNVPLIGEPMTVVSIYVPVTAVLTCNCGGPKTTVSIENSVSAECPSCHRVFNMAFNPTTMGLEVKISVPKELEKVPS